MNPATKRLLQAQQRPQRAVVMHQKWDELFFLHWQCDPKDVQKILPSGLTVDLFDGQAHIGVVGFQMNAVRPHGLPALPWLSYFNELNVRVYVRDAGGEPGVWFLSLDCDRAPAVHIARMGFNLPYEHARMQHVRRDTKFYLSAQRQGAPDLAEYIWSPERTAQTATPGTLDFHLIERYNFFTVKGGKLLRGQVHHTPYEVSPAKLEQWSELPIAWDNFPLTGRAPDLAHCSPGVSVEAFKLVTADA
jgi:uncharacterized protein YqjF (DUF2071 family)